MSLMAILLASITGSPHCAAMCGGFVALYSAPSPKSISPHVVYNVCRGIVYVCLGALAGFLGQTLNDLIPVSYLSSAAALAMGILLCIWGASLLIRTGTQNSSQIEKSFATYFYAAFNKILGSELASNAVIRAALVGAVSVLLPCGWLYAFVAVAAATGSPTQGALVLFVFWLGTLPVMAFLGGSLQYLGFSISKKFPKVTALLIIAAGLFALLGKVEVIPGGHSHQHHHHHHISHTAH